MKAQGGGAGKLSDGELCPLHRAHGVYLLELGRGQRVLDLLRRLRQRLPGGEVGQEAFLDVGVGKDRGHDLGRQNTGQVN